MKDALFAPMLAIVRRDVALAYRAGGGALQAVLFFALAVLVFGVAVGPDLPLMRRIAAPVLWAAALMATLVSLDGVFGADAEDGSLDAALEAHEGAWALVLAKALSHWLATSAPLIVATPLLGVLFGLGPDGAIPLVASLLAGTPALSLTGALVAALALSLRRSGVLMTILAAPLLMPALVFGVGAAEAGARGDPRFVEAFLLLCAVSLAALLIAPAAGGAAIRSSMT